MEYDSCRRGSIGRRNCIKCEEAAVRLEAVRVDDNHDEQSATAVALVSSMDDENLGRYDDIPIATTQVLSESDDKPMSDSKPRSSHRPAFISVTVLKTESAADDIGIAFEKEEGRVHISHIALDGLFEGTPICEGDQVLSVNSKGCQDRE